MNVVRLLAGSILMLGFGVGVGLFAGDGVLARALLANALVLAWIAYASST